MQTCAEYLNAAKVTLGNPTMSDRELGLHLGGYAQQSVANGRAGKMSDPMAVRVAEVLRLLPGEVLLVARAEREKDLAIRAHLLHYAKKAVGQVLAWVAGLAVTVALSLQPQPALASSGGDEGIRTLDGVLSPILP